MGEFIMKRISILFVVFFSLLFIAASGKKRENEGVSENGDKMVGLAMTTKSYERWVRDGENMKEEFEELGYEVDLQFAEDVVENQVSQIENMITKGVDILVIASIDGEALTEVLEQAENQDIPVIAYDR